MFFPVTGYRFAVHLSPEGRHCHVRFNVLPFWFVRGVGVVVISSALQAEDGGFDPRTPYIWPVGADGKAHLILSQENVGSSPTQAAVVWPSGLGVSLQS